MNSLDQKNTNSIKICLIIAVTILVFAVLKWTSSVSLLLVLSIFLFFVLSPIASKLEKIKVPKPIATILSLFILLFFIIIALLFLFYTVDLLIKTLPNYASRVTEFESFIKNLLNGFMDLPEDFSILGGLQIDWFNLIMVALRSISSKAISILSDGVMVFIFVMFLLMERDTLVPRFEQLFSTSNPHLVEQLFDRINKQISKYLALKFVISLATGLCFYLSCKAVGMEFALICGVLAVVMNFIPTIGSIVVTVITAFMTLLQFFPNWSPIIFVTIGCTLTQWVLGNILDPKLQGNKLNLSPFILLFSLTLWGYIWGIVGMFLAVPMMSMIQIVLANIDKTKPLAILLSTGKSKKASNKKHKEKSNITDNVIMPF